MQPDNFDEILQAKAHLGKIFEEKLFFRTLPTILFQMLFKIILSLKVIIKSTIDPENNVYRNS